MNEMNACSVVIIYNLIYRSAFVSINISQYYASLFQIIWSRNQPTVEVFFFTPMIDTHSISPNYRNSFTYNSLNKSIRRECDKSNSNPILLPEFDRYTWYTNRYQVYPHPSTARHTTRNNVGNNTDGNLLDWG